MKKEVTMVRIVCDYCEKILGVEESEARSKCGLCGKHICLEHSATVYFADITAEAEMLVCRGHLPKVLFNGHSNNTGI